ncbi:MAG: DeoR family transcriptional regulator [Thermoflexales bacterium]|nr:DeoR family transcriptional regulator [Thermoflexales bacterium]MDW8053865.1 ATP-binding protein [Anaerolineae bacterium]MDW8292396.1 ATP-binding protein [Anaerolineae bacterium]
MFTLEELNALLRTGEDERLIIVPASKATLDTLATALAALANARGGVLVITATGSASLTEKLRERMLQAMLRTEPPLVTPLPYFVLAADGTPHALVAEVPDGLPRVYGVNGRYVRREGTRIVPLHAEALHQLMLQRGEGSWESLCPPEATIDDLEEEKMRAYADQLGEADPIALLVRRRCIVRRGSVLQPTHAGLLLFGRDPQRWVSGAQVLCARFQGTTMDDAFVRQTIGGTLPEQIRRAEAFLNEHLPRYAQLRAWQRSEVSPYPPGVLREAVVNAVAHRDYRLSGDQIRVLLFADRVEVHSPGRLPGHITLQNLLRERYSRNEAIVQVLADLGFIERLGYGIDRMVRAMRDAGQPEPVFEEREASFSVTLYAKGEPLTEALPLSPQQQRIQKMLAFLQQHGRITNRDYQELCPGVNPETLRRDFAEMVERGVILRVGDKRGTYYILK